MRSIRVMSKELAEKIAAGEVVERPGSIVKELCENSIDAGSTAVTVETRQGGITYIRVTDNGSGIKADEVGLAFMRHSTSKTYNEQELFDVHTLGFRGEALASIAAVSHLTMTTRTATADFGMTAELSGGEMVSLCETGCPRGTGITVTDLFFNTPVRRKFLKKPAQEAAYIGDIISRLALSCPNVSFRLVQDGKTVLHSPGDGKLEHAVMAVYGKDTADNVLPVNYTAGDVKIYGVIGNGNIEKNNRSYQSFFVNGRYVKDKVISAAVQNGYVNNIMIGKFPFFVLFMELPPTMVDVNVHPNKLEVRFWNEDEASETVRKAVVDALRAERPIPGLEDRHKQQNILFTVVGSSDAVIPPGTIYPPKRAFAGADADTGIKNPPEDAANNTQASAEDGTQDKVREASGGCADNSEQNFSEVLRAEERDRTHFAEGAPTGAVYTQAQHYYQNNEYAHKKDAPSVQMEMQEVLQGGTSAVLADYRLVGQVFATYIIIQSGDVIYLIDQHAAHERLLYERMSKTMEAQAAQSQALLTPQVLSLNFAEKGKLIGILPELEALGFDIEPFGESEFIIRSVPVLMGNACSCDLINDILADFDTLKNCRAVDIKRAKLMQMACKHAIKGGDMLRDEELEELMHLIQAEKVPLTCPHGRPILISLTKKELEMRFKRIQS